MMDMNIAKFNIPLHVKKAFDKGEIDKVYKEMYLVADELAAFEARRYMAKKPSEYMEEKLQVMKGAYPKKTTWSSRVTKQISDYRERRLKYHMDNMVKLLELYVTSKIETDTE